MNNRSSKKYQRLKGGLIAKGTNIRRWARAKGYPPTTVYDAARGTRSGIKAVAVRAELEEFLND